MWPYFPVWREGKRSTLQFYHVSPKGLHFIKLLRIILAIFPRYNSEAWLLVLLFLFLKLKKKEEEEEKKKFRRFELFLSTNKCCCFYRVLLIYYKVLCMKQQLKNNRSWVWKRVKKGIWRVWSEERGGENNLTIISKIKL